MPAQEQINAHIASLAEPKQSEVQTLHTLVLRIAPKAKLWFDTGVDEKGKVVTNPTIGYGEQTLNYANGTTKEFFRIGISATKTGISVYILGLKDKAYLVNTYANAIGKAKVTGYCISFKSIKDIELSVLEEALRYRLAMQD